jgi:hypothetical protein
MFCSMLIYSPLSLTPRCDKTVGYHQSITTAFEQSAKASDARISKLETRKALFSRNAEKLKTLKICRQKDAAPLVRWSAQTRLPAETLMLCLIFHPDALQKRSQIRSAGFPRDLLPLDAVPELTFTS